MLTADIRERLASLAVQSGAANRARNFEALGQQGRDLIGPRAPMMAAAAMYWTQAAGIDHAEIQWHSFLALNRLPADRPHSPEVAALRKQLVDDWKRQPDQDRLSSNASALLHGYAAERDGVSGEIRVLADDSPDLKFENRTSACPAPGGVTAQRTQEARIRKIDSAEAFYPAESKRLYEQGAVVLNIRLDATGCPQAIAVAMSSGSDALDTAAKQLVFQTAAYDPASVGGKAVAAKKMLKIRFAMHD